MRRERARPFATVYAALPFGAAVSAALAIAAAPWATGESWLAFVFKPLTTILIIVWALPRGADDPARGGVLAGLALSLGGDVALLWPVTGFLPGLVFFLLAHSAYLVAFTRDTPLLRWAPAVLAYIVVAGALLSVLWGGVPTELRGPVLVYVAALIAMAAQAACRWRRWRDSGRATLVGRAALGAGVFVASDAVLAIETFAHPIAYGVLWGLSAYWLGQGLIAASLAPPRS